MVDYVADFTLEEQPEIEADFSIEVSNTDHNTLLNRDLPNQHPIGAITGLDSALSGKQDVLTAGEGISIENGVISATVQSAVWGNITGTLSDQTDLQNALNGKLDSSALDGYATENWVTNQGYLTQIVSADVTTALGYTPYNSTNPSGYQTASQVATAVATETNARELADNGLQAQIDAITSASDVTDIVGTYAELQAYDISTVPVNDIIKVLVDSTHDNAATYYRCVENNNVKSWSYIGPEGAYYTKGESDSRYVPQTRTINGYDLSSNVTLAASDVGALPSNTVIGNGTLTIQKNGGNVQTFSANQSGNAVANISVPTDTSDLTNGAGFITGISFGDVTTALGYIPYDSSNPGEYTSNIGTVTSVNNSQPDSLGNVTLSIPSDTSDLTNGAGFITSSALANYVTTDTVQDISAKKTFFGEKAILFKQTASTDKLGFTLYNTSGSELGALEYRPNTISGGALINLNTSQSGTSWLGFRYWSNINIIAPKPANGNYYIPVNFTDGTNTVTASNTGLINIGTLLPTVNDATITITQGGTTKGSFTLNQSSGATIALDAGGGSSYTAGTNISIASDVISTSAAQVIIRRL